MADLYFLILLEDVKNGGANAGDVHLIREITPALAASPKPPANAGAAIVYVNNIPEQIVPLLSSFLDSLDVDGGGHISKRGRANHLDSSLLTAQQQSDLLANRYLVLDWTDIVSASKGALKNKVSGLVFKNKDF